MLTDNVDVAVLRCFGVVEAQDDGLLIKGAVIDDDVLGIEQHRPRPPGGAGQHRAAEVQGVAGGDFDKAAGAGIPARLCRMKGEVHQPLIRPGDDPPAGAGRPQGVGPQDHPVIERQLPGIGQLVRGQALAALVFAADADPPAAGLARSVDPGGQQLERCGAEIDFAAPATAAQGEIAARRGQLPLRHMANPTASGAGDIHPGL